MTGSKMFPFITCTWNPLSGKCLHNCLYCWARKLAADRKMAKYQGEPRLIEKELLRQFKPGEFVFVCDMLDLFGPWVPWEFINSILEKLRHSPGRFLFLTKNPGRYVEFLAPLQHIDGLFGVTLETNRSTDQYSRALEPVERWESFFELECGPKFVSIEPIMDFDLDIFADWIFNISSLESVAIGYDNYDNKLPEPSLAKTMQLIERLEKAGITVYRKTLREAWNSA